MRQALVSQGIAFFRLLRYIAGHNWKFGIESSGVSAEFFTRLKECSDHIFQGVSSAVLERLSNPPLACLRALLLAATAFLSDVPFARYFPLLL